MNELAKRVELSKDTIRYYIKIGLLTPKYNPDNGYKLFNDKDIQRLHFICKAKYLGFTLKEIKQIFFECEQGNDPCPMVREFLQRHIETNNKHLQELICLQARMETAWENWQKIPDSQTKSAEYCAMIESVVSKGIAIDNANQMIGQFFPFGVVNKQNSSTSNQDAK
ncbi:MAG: MerR family transcriptional regulator [Methylococcales bacterium]